MIELSPVPAGISGVTVTDLVVLSDDMSFIISRSINRHNNCGISGSESPYENNEYDCGSNRIRYTRYAFNNVGIA